MRYRAYGLLIDSAWPLPPGVATDEPLAGTPDLLIRPGSIGAELERDPTAGCYRFAGDVHQFSWPLFGAVEIRQAQEILIDPAPAVPEGLVAHVLVGPVLADVLLSRGMLALHASAVRLGDRAVAFVGPSGAGKSTLAAALCARGATPHADDLVAVEPRTGEAPFGTSLSKLSPGALSALGHDATQYPVVYAGIDKRRAAMPGAVLQPAPLAAVYRLEDGPALAFEPVPSATAMFRLCLEVFRIEVERFAVSIDTLLARAAAVAERVPCYVLKRPRELTELDALADAVARHALALPAPDRPAT